MKQLTKTLLASSLISLLFSVADFALHKYISILSVSSLWKHIIIQGLGIYFISFLLLLALGGFWIKRLHKALILSLVTTALATTWHAYNGGLGVVWHLLNTMAHAVVLFLLAWISYMGFKIK